MEIRKDANGHDVVWSELGGKAISLNTNGLFILASGMQVLYAANGVDACLSGSDRPARLRPHEIPMVEYWAKQRGLEELNVFAGEPAPDG